jgi:glutathione reductase (NADPH)
MRGRGVPEGSVHLDWPALMRFKRTFTDPVPEDREKGFQEAGIVTFHGIATFVDHRTLLVGDQALTSRNIVIAAGARPQTLQIPGEEYLTTSEQFLQLETLPKQIVFVGGGYIAAELAHVAARAGAEATIIHRGKRPLEGFDADLVTHWQQATQEAGIKLELNAAVGAHVFGPHADDVINLFALAMRSGVKASDVRRALYTYPSVSGDVSYMV